MDAKYFLYNCDLTG